jgi:hypothetical protein
MAIDTTVGGASANSYADFTDYTAYWAQRLFNPVPTADQPTVETALMWACRLMDSIFRWVGSAVTDTQALTWPRNGMVSINNFPIDPTTIPAQLKNAQCEFAGILLSGDRTEDSPDTKVIGSQLQLTSIRAGSVGLSFGHDQFSTLESFDAFVRSLGADMAYLSKAIPDSVRLQLPPVWYVQAQLKRKILFGAL